MSSEIPESSTDTPAEQPEATIPNLTVTVVANGPATFTREISNDAPASILAKHDIVELAIERELISATDFETVIDPVFEGNGPTVSKALLIDRLIDEHAMDGYQRAGSTDDWTLEITGPATDWKRLSLDLVPDLHRSETDEGAAVRRLWSLAADNVTNDGAILAALDIVDQHDIATHRKNLTDLLAESTAGSE